MVFYHRIRLFNDCLGYHQYDRGERNRRYCELERYWLFESTGWHHVGNFPFPPFTGFFGKYLLLSSAFANYLPFVVLAIIASLIGAYLYLRLMVLSLSREGEGHQLKMTSLQALVLILSLAGTVGGWLVLLIK